MPPWAITEHPRFKFGMTLPQAGLALLERNECCIQGIRTQESFRRYRMMAGKANDSFISRKAGAAYGYPIYDWNSIDVWRLVKQRGYDYNRVYDEFNRTKLHGDLLHQRCNPPYGEEPLRGLWIWAQCWPELWHKMLYRVKGVATAWRYSNTELYGTGELPVGMNWKEFVELQIGNYSEIELQNTVRRQVARAVSRHYARTNDPMPDYEPHPLTGCSWRFMAKIAIKGDLKGRQIQMLAQQSTVALKALGITLDEAVERYGTEQFKKEYYASPAYRRRHMAPRRSAQGKQLQPEQRSAA
jgi:predicted phosphoadenosine phosphosulfate sulfurtransferase